VIESFGALLRQARTAAALTQEELADRAQLTDRGIRYLERGLRRPNRDTVERLARGLGLSDGERAAFVAAARPRRAGAPSAPGELRPPPSPLVGREHQVREVRERLSDHETRLLTLTGTGGVGKTSLALVAATDLHVAFPGGTAWVPLASLDDAALLPAAVSHALGLLDTGGPATTEALRAALAQRPTLVVLDNVEHLAAAGFVADLLATCPQLTVLATSRSPLRIRAEQELPVPPLPTPSNVPARPVHALAANPAVDLFLRRAQAVQPSFVLNETNATAVAEICRRLDGLPLAIELAAARIRVLVPSAILGRLDDRLGFLTGGAHDLPPRQRTMRGTVAWSYELLSDIQQGVFAQLAVFEGSFGLAALEAVVQTDPTTTLDAVESLHRSNLLLLADSADDEPRFRMLGTIRDFGLECLTHRGEGHDLRERHAAHYLALAEQETRGFYGPDSTHWLDMLEEDRANLRAALRWFLDQRDAARGLRLGAALWWFWYVRGYATEGRAQLNGLLALPAPLPGDDAVRARAAALLGAGSLAHTQGDYTLAHRLLAESIDLYRSLADERATAEALLAAGFTARVQEDYQAAADLLGQSLTLARSSGHAFVVAAALHHLGMIAADANADLAIAETLLGESLTLYESLGLPRFIALVQLSLGDVATARQDHSRAHQLLSEGLSGMRRVGERLGIHGALDSLAGLAAGEHHWSRAVTLAAAAEQLRTTTGSRSWPVVERRRNRWLACARDTLSDQEFSSARAQGTALTLEQAVSYALAEEQPPPPETAEQGSCPRPLPNDLTCSSSGPGSPAAPSPACWNGPDTASRSLCVRPARRSLCMRPARRSSYGTLTLTSPSSLLAASPA
jgi:predicted ATPase/DNA-binding XRE family transcriptional regulator